MTEIELEDGEKIVNKFAYADGGINVNDYKVEITDGGKTYTANTGDVIYHLNIKTHPDVNAVQEITDMFLGARENKAKEQEKIRAYVV